MKNKNEAEFIIEFENDKSYVCIVKYPSVHIEVKKPGYKYFHFKETEKESYHVMYGVPGSTHHLNEAAEYTSEYKAMQHFLKLVKALKTVKITPKSCRY
jgi:hypothetical protein